VERALVVALGLLATEFLIGNADSWHLNYGTTALNFIPPFVLAFVGMLVAQEAVKRRTAAGVERERAARTTLAWWMQRFHYRAADFTREGLRFWRVARALQLGALLWAIALFVRARPHA
jgi:hypothetical protein